MEKQTCKSCAEKERIIAILQETCASYETRIKRFQTLARSRRENAAQQKAGVKPEKVVLQPVDRTLSECPRSKWYTEAGRKLRADGWQLRQTGPRWNAHSALIEKRPIDGTHAPATKNL